MKGIKKMSEDILNIERIESYKASDLYKDDVLETLVANVEGHVKNLTFDVNEQKGRDQIASIAYSVSRIKTTLETKRKSLTEGYRAEIDKINKRGNAVKERLQAA
jgi:sporulation protein YlmC with PRC-barrel domain